MDLIDWTSDDNQPGVDEANLNYNFFQIAMDAFHATIQKFDYQFASNRFQAHLRLNT